MNQLKIIARFVYQSFFIFIVLFVRIVDEYEHSSFFVRFVVRAAPRRLLVEAGEQRHDVRSSSRRGGAYAIQASSAYVRTAIQAS